MATNVLDFGAQGDGVADDTAAIQAALASGARTVLFPAGTYRVTAKLIWTGHRDLIGEGPKQSIIASSADSWTLEATVSGNTLSVRHLQFTGDQTLMNNAGIHVFDNGDRPFEHLELSGFKRQALKVVQSVNPILRDIRAYNCALNEPDGIVELDKGAQSIVAPNLDGLYLGYAANGLVLNGARNALMKGIVIEACTTGLNAANSDGVMVGGWFEANLMDMLFLDSTITRIDTITSTRRTVWSSADGADRCQPVITPGFGGHYTTDFRVVTDAATWTDCLMGVSSKSFRVSPNPGGNNYEKLRVNRTGLYLVSFWASFRNVTAAPIGCNARLVKGTDSFAEIPGAYGAIQVQPGAAAMVQASAIVSIVAGEDIKLQFSSSSKSGRIDTVTDGLAAPSSDAKAGVVLQSLLAQA